jgi:hypothetical protein
MNRDFIARFLSIAIAFAAMTALCVPLLGGCGVKGPLKLPTPPAPASGTLPSEPPTAPATGKPSAEPSTAPAPQPTEPKP